jgi:hypothetical protein
MSFSLPWPFSVIGAKIDALSAKIDLVISMEKTIMSDVSVALDGLEAQAKAIDGAEASAEASFTALAALIASLKTNTTDPATAARIQAVSDDLKARAAALAAAVAAAPTS